MNDWPILCHLKSVKKQNRKARHYVLAGHARCPNQKLASTWSALHWSLVIID